MFRYNAILIIVSSIFLFNVFHSGAVAFCDAAEPWQVTFQDPASPVMEGIIHLHHDIMFYGFIIGAFVLWLLFKATFTFHYTKNPIASKISHSTGLEIIWTILPAVVLGFIAVPSLALLYSTDEVIEPAITIKAIGHQWYWSYEYSDYVGADGASIAFDSYMIAEDDLELGQLRLLEVDNRIVVPVNTHVRVLVTSADVLHCWAVPSLGIKIDAVPGRLNQTSFFAKREGVFFGQCSELCGVNHGFMPIVVEAVSLDNYVSWVSSNISVNE